MYDIPPPVFRTPLGTVKCRILINGAEISSNLLINDFSIEPNGQILRWKTNHHLIKVIYFNPKTYLLPPDMKVNDCGCWLFRISKLSDHKEDISLLCELSNPGKNIDGGPENGEGLVALTFHDGINMVSIGSENEEYFHKRAALDDWFPKRFYQEEAETSDYNNLMCTKIGKTGLKIDIPALRNYERIQFQFIAAWSEYAKGKTDTWFCVDQDYHKLLGSISFGD